MPNIPFQLHDYQFICIAADVIGIEANKTRTLARSLDPHPHGRNKYPMF